MLHSGKFWLKSLVFGITALLCLAAVLSALMFRIFNTENIDAFIQKNFSAHGCQIKYNTTIGRKWLPRPTLILKDLSLSSSEPDTPTLNIAESKMGFGWSSLWSDAPILEKWILLNPTLTLDSKHHLPACLQQDPSSKESFQLNRIIINNGSIRYHTKEQNIALNNLQFSLRRADSDGRPFDISGTLQNIGNPISWQGAGHLVQDDAGWSVPALKLNLQTVLLKNKLDAQIAGSLNWQNQTALFRDFNLQAESGYQNLHINVRSPLLQFKNGYLHLNTLNGALTAGSENNQWDGSFKLDKTNLYPTVLTVANFELKGSHKNDRLQTNFTFSSPLVWQKGKGIDAPKLHLSTLQDTINRLPRPRFISTLEGQANFSLNTWEGRLKGAFDRQALALAFKYQRDAQPRPHLDAGIALQKLNLTPYLEDLKTQPSLNLPSLLAKSWLPDIEANLQIGSIQTAGLQLENVESLLTADKEHIALHRFKAGLYGGKTEGGLSIAATQPASYHLQQNAKGIQIQPLLQDLFGFHSFSGSGDAVIDIKTTGNDRAQMIQALNGSLLLDITNGAWHGIDMDSILKNGISSEKIDNSNLKTPFHHFILNSEIEKGISHHINTELFSDSLHVVSSGYTDLNTQKLSENLLISNVLQPKNKPIPLKIGGTVQNPSITLDYSRLTNGMNTPAEKQKALQETIQEQWKWLKPR